jgi:DNA modification methylase
MNKLESTLNGIDLFGEPINQPSRGPIADKFGFPPFSVLDARQGSWQDRKRAWTNIGIASEVGRDAECNASSLRPLIGNRDRMVDKGTSVFDPTLCECMYRWFCPAGGQVVDPFAGGSVRGVVAGMLGIKYWGSELRKEQVLANINQGEKIKPDIMPEWICGDSTDTLKDAPLADFVFSCPPYGDLEKYSDDPDDLSSMEWHTFSAAYGRIILKSVKAMKDDSFACFVVGDFRDKKGFYRDFVSTTISHFKNAGAELYNEAILLTPLGNAAMRAPAFSKGRKMVKVHQNVLVFCKGDNKKAAAKLS